MTDFQALLNRTRDRIMTPEPSMGDIVRAGMQATAGVPYAQALQARTNADMQQLLQQYGVLKDQRDFAASREQQMWERAQIEAQQGDANVRQVLELAAAYGNNAADAQRLAAYVFDQDPDDPSEIPTLLAQGAAELGLEARPDLTFMNTAQGGVVGIDPSGGTRTVVPGAPETPKPNTGIGKINADLAAGLITPAQAMQAQRDLYTTSGETWRAMTPEERESYGLQGPAQISSSGKVQTLGSAGITLYDSESGNIIAQVGGTPLTKSQTGSQAIEIAEEARATTTRLSELDNALSELRRNPNATGLSGLAIEKVGGVLQQAANWAGSDGNWLPTAEVQRTRTELASLLGQYIPTVTGDDSGRYSDQDMRRAEAALPAKNPTASFAQVRSALLTLRDIETRARARALMRLDGFAPGIDLTYPDGRNRYGEQLIREGKTPQEAADIVIDLLDKYDIPMTVEGIR